MAGWLKQPDPRVQQAFKSLRGDPDFMQVLAWVEESLYELDRAKRTTMDAALLRQQQGAAATAAQFVNVANGNATAISPRPTSLEGRPREQ